jgi:hypothetical protein
LGVSLILFCAGLLSAKPASAEGGACYVDDSGWVITTRPDGSESVEKSVAPRTAEATPPIQKAGLVQESASTTSNQTTASAR